MTFLFVLAERELVSPDPAAKLARSKQVESIIGEILNTIVHTRVSGQKNIQNKFGISIKIGELKTRLERRKPLKNGLRITQIAIEKINVVGIEQIQSVVRSIKGSKRLTIQTTPLRPICAQQ